MTQILRRENYPLRAEEDNALPRSPLPLPHTNWQVRSFVVHSPHHSLSSCHEWMWLRCWTLGSAANSTCYMTSSGGLQEWLHRCRGQLATVSKASSMKALCKSPKVNHHCYCTFGVATHWLYQCWDNYIVGPSPKCDECFGLCNHFMKHIIVYVTLIKLQRLLLSFCGKDIYLSLECWPSFPEWLRSQLQK